MSALASQNNMQADNDSTGFIHQISKHKITVSV